MGPHIEIKLIGTVITRQVAFLDYWEQALEVLLSIEKRGLHLSPEDREYLETLRQKAGAGER